MIMYFAPGGRLGNQIFQLAFLLSIARIGETCLLSRMKGALQLFDHGLSVFHVPEGVVYKLFDRIFVPFFLQPLCRLGIVASFREENGKLIERKGLVPGMRVIFGYFQSESFVKAEANSRLLIIPTVRQQARDFIDGIAAFASGRKLIFVHIRRTDYLNHEVLGNRNTSLPLSYYEKTIRWFLNNTEHPFFIFVGDDPEFAHEHFAWLVDKVISHNDPFTDFAVMTLCNGAILSNSTLAWWGARSIENPLKVFAPKYWLGWKSGRWYPEGIRPAFAECVDVE